MDKNDPLTELASAAVSLHEMFSEYVKAGFTPEQALYLVGQIIRPQSSGS